MAGSLGPVIGRYHSTTAGGGEGQSDGIITHNRKCRDIAFLVFFIAFWVAMVINSSFAFNQGNPLRLTYGLDYKGNICGDRRANPDLHGLEVRYWVNPNQVDQTELRNTQFKLKDARSICLKSCPVTSEDSLRWVCDYPEGDIHLSKDEWIHRNYDYFDFLTPEMRNASLQLLGPCYPLIFPTVNVFWSCQYIARASNVSLQHWQQMGGVTIREDLFIDKSIHKFVNSRSSVLKRYIADIGKAWPVLIVCGGIIPLFFSLIWLLLIRHFVSGMTWITVFFFNVLIVSVTMLYYLKAGWIGNDSVSPIIGDHDPYYHLSGREATHLHAVAALMTIIMIVSVVSSLAIIRRILMAKSVMKVASKVVGEVQALIVFPIAPYTILAIFFIIWFAAALYMFSSGQVVQNICSSNCCAYDLDLKRVRCDRCCGYSIHYTPHIGVGIAFHFLGCYWATQFIKACSSTVIAGSVASYYWAQGEPLQGISFLPVFSSTKRLLRYSLGSVAIGSLMVSLIESLRWLLKLVHRKLKFGSAGPGSWYGSSSQCSLNCIEWTIKSVNHNGYIMIAITGQSFFTASAIATELIRNNIMRIGKVNVIGDVILLLGKVCVSLSSVVFAFLMLDTHKYRSSHNKISSPLFPVLVCGALSYVVATLFFAVVEMSIDTMILSFCQDSEKHQGSARLGPPLLIETLNDENEMRRLTH